MAFASFVASAAAALLAADAGTPPDAGVPDPALEAAARVALDCQMCHSLALVNQQRLNAAQWTATLQKMRTFGALLDEPDIAPLAAYLSKVRGPDAVLRPPARLKASAVAKALDPLPDGFYAKGDAKAGQTLFQARCAVCHGPTATGLIGPALVKRPVLYRAPDVAEQLKTGRGRMPPHADLDTKSVAALLAYLRTLGR